MTSPSLQIVAGATSSWVDAWHRATIPIGAFVAFAAYLVSVDRGQPSALASLLVGCATYGLRRVLQHVLRRERQVEIGDAGIAIDGRLRVRYEDVIGVLPLAVDGHATIRVGARRGGILLRLPNEDTRLAADIANAIDARANLRVRTFSLRRTVMWGVLLGVIGLAGSLAVASAEGSGLLASGFFALSVLGVYLAWIGPHARLRVGRDGIDVAMFGIRVATLRAQEGLVVEAEHGRVRLVSRGRTITFQVAGYESGLVADEIRAALHSDGADARLVVPRLAPGDARSWLESVRRRGHAGDYRGKVETPDDLRAVIKDGARPPTEQVYAALRLVAQGEGNHLVETARNTAISPRLRASLDATLAADDEALVNELEALAVEEASRDSRARQEK